MAAVALHKRPFDLLILVFLLVHIPVTVLIDSQACKSSTFCKSILSMRPWTQISKERWLHVMMRAELSWMACSVSETLVSRTCSKIAR